MTARVHHHLLPVRQIELIFDLSRKDRRVADRATTSPTVSGPGFDRLFGRELVRGELVSDLLGEAVTGHRHPRGSGQSLHATHRGPDDTWDDRCQHADYITRMPAS